MNERYSQFCTAFEGSRRIAAGELAQVARKVKEVLSRGERAPVLIFDDVTSEQVEIDFRGTVQDVIKRLGAVQSPAEPEASPTLESDTPRGPGRPKLGVVAREVTLLPRHWDWLNSQPGGASVALRKLVEEGRRTNEALDRTRQSREATYRFMTTLAGNRPGYEEATRALFAGKRDQFQELIKSWPADIRDYAAKLALNAFPDPAPVL